LIRTAESLAEAETVRAIRAAANDPRNWAAGMTYLERKYPDRWGRRTDDNMGPKVIVQIGIKDSDVHVQIGAGSPCEPSNLLTEHAEIKEPRR
jgi:hypothetical protein